ncbi:MAG TPA: peptide ABC transporter substrate-binding protein [Chloroflexota bacterium]
MRIAILMLLLVVMTACAPPSRGAGDGPNGANSPQASPKRIVAAILSDPPAIVPAVTSGAGLPGQASLFSLVQSGLTQGANDGTLTPVLAEAVPSIENGLWTVFPDGRMETTWKIRPTATWHDGTPLTAEDVVFAARVERDREVPIPYSLSYEAVDRVEAVDPHTLVVYWKAPFIDADAFSASNGTSPTAIPMPRHLLEQRYLDEKGSFVQLPYWSSEFVGTGPFSLREWGAGTHALLRANDQFALGRPKIDEVEARFLADPSTLGANILAGAVDATLGKSLSLEQAIQLQDQWRGGRVETADSSGILIYPQLINTSPAVVADVRFRKALMQATDRQQLVDTIMYGRSVVADNFFTPSAPEFAGTLDAAVRYPYDVAAASRQIEALGYAKGQDGLYRDSAGQTLSVEIRTNQVDTNIKTMLVVADQWQRMGVKVEPVPMSPESQTDGAYVASYPAFLLYRQPSDLSGLKRQHRSQTPLPENGFRGGNYSRYQDAAFSDLIDRVFRTVPRGERLELLRQVVHQVTDLLTRMGLFYDVQPTMVANRLQGVPAANNTGGDVWNAHLWDLQ